MHVNAHTHNAVMCKQANEMRDGYIQCVIIPLVNLLILSLSEALKNGNVEGKHVFPPQ